MKNRRSHRRVIVDCYLELKNDDGSRMLTIMRKYGKKTREAAIQMLKEDAAEKCGMTLEEFEKSLAEE